LNPSNRTFDHAVLCVARAGGLTINDQVQGGALSYRHNLALLAAHGFRPHPVHMRIAFGKGDKQWTNHSPSKLTTDLQPEIERFGRLLKRIKALEPVYIFLPISKVHRHPWLLAPCAAFVAGLVGWGVPRVPARSSRGAGCVTRLAGPPAHGLLSPAGAALGRLQQRLHQRHGAAPGRPVLR
jgi:hypothetical protein